MGESVGISIFSTENHFKGKKTLVGPRFRVLNRILNEELFYFFFSYQMLSNDHIASIPIEAVTQPNRTLVVIWCTNAPSMIQAVKETFLPKWNLRLLATWYWIKVTFFTELHENSNSSTVNLVLFFQYFL